MSIRAMVLAAVLLLPAAPNAPAPSHGGELASYFGIWIGSSIITEETPRKALVNARDIGVAIWGSKTGFDMTWKSPGRYGVSKTRARFVATRKPEVFTVTSVEPPLTGEEKLLARFEGGSLVVHRSGKGHDPELIARYELSVSNGRMTFKYTLSQGGEQLERVEGLLSKAKILP